MKNLPVVILINLIDGYYDVWDNTLRRIWSEDMTLAKYERLLYELDRAWGAPLGGALASTLCLRRLREVYAGERVWLMTLQHKETIIQTRVLFADRGGGNIFEIWMLAPGEKCIIPRPANAWRLRKGRAGAQGDRNDGLMRAGKKRTSV